MVPGFNFSLFAAAGLKGKIPVFSKALIMVSFFDRAASNAGLAISVISENLLRVFPGLSEYHL